MRKKYHILLLSLILSILTSTGFVYKVLDDDNDFEIVKNLDIFHSVIRDLNIYYVDEIDAQYLIGIAIESMLNRLDPYTVYYPESKIEDYLFLSTGTYAGIGAIVSPRDNQLIVTEILEKMPAHIAGLKTGDIIISIDGFSTKDKDLEMMSNKLNGQINSNLVLEILRENNPKPITLNIKRNKIEQDDIPYFGIISDSVGYIKLAGFNREAASKVRTAFLSLKSKGMNKLVLDLRDNPGGLLIEAVGIVNLFVDKGSEIVSIKGKDKDANKVFYATVEPIDKTIPITVLINGMSASASEIVSGALQDLDRAVIVGQRSYGKGLVQNTKDLSYNTKIKITTAKYYIPSGRCIQALDYSHRNSDGTVNKVADSLTNEFKTKNGRSVFDGGGINPDLIVYNKDFENFVADLDKNFLIFDFITNYLNTNAVADSAADLDIGESGFVKFQSFLKANSDRFITKVDSDIEDIKKNLIQESGSNTKLAEAIKSLKFEYDKEKGNSAMSFKKSLIPLLNKRISKRLYFERGFILNSLSNDDILFEAIIILKNKNQYNKITRNF